MTKTFTIPEILQNVLNYTDETSDYIFDKNRLHTLVNIFEKNAKIKMFKFFSEFKFNKTNYYFYKIFSKYIKQDVVFNSYVEVHIPKKQKNYFENNNLAFFNENKCYLTINGLACLLTSNIYDIDMYVDREELLNEVILFIGEACKIEKGKYGNLVFCNANTTESKHFNFKMLNLVDGANDNFSFEKHLMNKIAESTTGIYVRKTENWDKLFNVEDFEKLFEKLKNNEIIDDYFINNSGEYDLSKHGFKLKNTSKAENKNDKENINNDFSFDPGLSKIREKLLRQIKSSIDSINESNPFANVTLSSAVAVDQDGNVIDLGSSMSPLCGNNGELPDSFKHAFPQMKFSKVKGEDTEIEDIIADNSCLRYIDNTKIVKKTMFYNENVETDINNIQKLIRPTKFKAAIKELKLNKLGTGISCMLYGEPGTGKTESVLQIARESKRDIIQVDLSQVESKWVGESSKNIQSIFDSYKEILDISKKQKKNIPILLLNECDGFISKRLSDISGEAAKESNTGANIILENLEKFEGIVFLTTNLVNNLDDALDRRLLYKVNLEKPNEQTRKKLWKNKISNLSSDTVDLLAKKYKFSGAQIDNIFKKIIIDYIITTKKDYSFDALQKYCDNEIAINKKDEGKPIGFK